MNTPASNQDTDSQQAPASALEQQPEFSPQPIPFDVFRELVESPDDFLGLLAYSLYKRHKIEWIQTHPDDDHEDFKKVACTPQQLSMYRYQSEHMAKNFIDVSLEQLGEEMRNSILEGEVMSRLEELETTVTSRVSTLESSVITRVDGLKLKFLKNFGNHMLSGLASVVVALIVFGTFSLYSLYQERGGLEGMFKSPPAQEAPALNTTPHT